MIFPEERISSIFVVIPVQVFIAVIFLFSLLYGIGELIIFSLLLLFMGMLAFIWGRESIKGIRCIIKPDRTRIFPEEESRLTVHAINSRLLPLLLTIYLSIHDTSSDTGGQEILSERCGLLWFQKSSFDLKFQPGKRGVFNVGPLHLSVGDIFGFNKKEKEEHLGIEIIVYPRLVKTRPIPIPKREFFGIPGSRSPVKDPAYFLGTRDYQPGQPSRNIHWKSSARYSRIQEKLFEPSVREKVLIILDVDRFAEKRETELFESTIETIASQAVHLAGEGNAVGFVSNCLIGKSVPCVVRVSSNRNQISKILECLARVRMEPDGSIMDILSKTIFLPYGLACLYFSYEIDARTSEAKEFLRSHNTPANYIFSRGGTDHDKNFIAGNKVILGDILRENGS
ncbi:MAG: DUF58 domain-containing protein [Deltaproteobacteria bacterium]|nr:DUF58 domain-containing protein [Deltaproteobacteria bacterium]